MTKTRSFILAKSFSHVLCSELYEFDAVVTPELLDAHGQEYQKNPFVPFSVHDLRLVDNTEGGFTLYNDAWVRWTTLHLVDGVKMLCLSDDDYMVTGDPEAKERYDLNLSRSKEAFTKLAKCYGVQVEINEDANSYGINCFIPVTEFDWVKTGREWAHFLSKCLFNTKADIEAVQADIIGSRG